MLARPTPSDAPLMAPVADEQIRAGSILPARRESLTLHTDDGLDLIAELATPVDREPVGTLICVHPLPTHGGMMDSHVLRKASWRLPALAGIAVLRFNTRGTTSSAGTSQGSFDEARGEGRDLAAAIAFGREMGLPDPWLLGWSFGTDVVLKHGDVDPVRGALLLSPPLRFTTESELLAWSGSSRSLVALVPEHDDYLPPAEALTRFAVVPGAQVIGVPGAKHLWVGEAYVRIVLDEITRRVNPQAAPLPTIWSADDAHRQGAMEKWSEL
jgi:alpha/beta superfamily hydrolase